MKHKTLHVSPDRLPRWIEGFKDRHGGQVDLQVTEKHVAVHAADGAIARVHIPWPPVDLSRLPLECLARHAARSRRLLLILVRRGGFGSAIVEDSRVLASKHGTKYVQGKTAAGGWSQQRYARRRGNQADALVASAADAVRRMFDCGDAAGVVGLVCGGDKALLAKVEAHIAHTDRTLATWIEGLPRGARVDIPDPRLNVTKDLAKRINDVCISLDEPSC